MSQRLFQTLVKISMTFALAGSVFLQAQPKTGVNDRPVTVGNFSLRVPSNWNRFSTDEYNQLLQEYRAQSKEMFSQYTGGEEDPAQAVHLAAYHLSGSSSAFIMVSFTIPPQADLINLLKSQAEEKAKYGIQNGYIKKYLGSVSIDDSDFAGFYVKCVGSGGAIELSAGLEAKALKNTLIQLTLISPNGWNEQRAVDQLSTIIKSVKLAASTRKPTSGAR